MTARTAERYLTLTLYFFGLTCLLAFIPFVMPVSWMKWVHEQVLGMGQFPEAPITVYLARSTSALCGMYGLLGLLMERNIIKYERLIYFHGRTLLVVCIIGVTLAWECGLPMAWVIIDGIGGVTLGLVTIYLHRQACAQPAGTDD